VNRDKRASLSSGLLGLKDAAPATEDGTSSTGAALSDTVKAGPRAHVLYTKGAASASGFRPDQWSFDGAAAAEPAPAAAPVPEPPPQRLVMPFPAKVSAPQPGPPAIPAMVRRALARKPALLAIAVVAAIALGIAVVAARHGAGDAPVAALPAAPTPSPLVAPAPDVATAGETAALMARADQLLAIGDIVAARSFYERAAEQGHAPAMTAVGKTHDPLFLEQAGVRGSRGDAVRAADWYRRAGAAGDAEAEQRLKRLIARYAG
jgi:hypothetical protein